MNYNNTNYLFAIFYATFAKIHTMRLKKSISRIFYFHGNI
jgi:hypothetical protein